MNKPTASVEYHGRRFEMHPSPQKPGKFIVTDRDGKPVTSPLPSSGAIDEMVRRVFHGDDLPPLRHIRKHPGDNHDWQITDLDGNPVSKPAPFADTLNAPIAPFYVSKAVSNGK